MIQTWSSESIPEDSPIKHIVQYSNLFTRASERNRDSGGEIFLRWHVCFLYFFWNHVCLAYWLKTQFYSSLHCRVNKFPEEKAVFYCTPCNINKTDSQILIPESLLLGIMQCRTYFGECLHKSLSWTLQSSLFMQMESRSWNLSGRQPPPPWGSTVWLSGEQFGSDWTRLVVGAFDWCSDEGWGAKVGQKREKL